MIKVHKFTFNSFQENTYIVYDETGECIIVDPGCYESYEKEELESYIRDNKLKPVKLINTHSHVDHILGNNFVINTFNIGLYLHEKGLAFHKHSKDHGTVFGMNVEDPIDPAGYLKEGDIIKFGNSELEVLYTPGHVDGHICLLSDEGRFVIVGDVLFNMSIGRTDLPSGDYDMLMRNIIEKLMILPDDYTVYPGHMAETTIGFEKANNPFLVG